MVKRLESLELHGYKTFATIMRLEFPGQITAIVGPNGSGKSNIADSIRWVLGEQSYSLLRAKKTEDMIFSGSQQRPRAGMASVEITFNNKDQWLPIDYSEVSIARRAYRDGQNDYLLNGQRVRLKDISEILSQTGLSERTYTIIGQGLVDVALALRPDERRKLFEEAAGIGLYRSRKVESLRRLENTQKNLDRIKDILTEIRPRLRSLERQTQRFAEYQRVRADLEVLLREWYGFHWHQKQEDLSHAQSAYQNHEQRLNTLRKNHSGSEEKISQAREMLQTNRRAYEMAHRELSEYHQKLEKTSRELAILDERQRSFTQQKGNLEIDIAHAEEEIKDLESQEQNYLTEIENRQIEYDAASDEMNAVDIRLTEVASKKDTADKELKTIREKRVKLETEKVQASAHLEELQNRLDTLSKENTKLSDALRSLNQTRTDINGRIKVQEKEVSAAQEKYDVIVDELKTKAARIDEVRKNNESLGQEIAASEAQQAKLQAQLDVLKQAEAALSGYSEGSKTVVEASRKGRLPAGIEPLSKYLLVDEKYEKAISAALGELADLLIVPSGEEDILIEYLESSKNDRVAMLTAGNPPSQNHNPQIKKTKGVLGYADELIQVDAEHQNLVKGVFSEILIVEDKRSALEVKPTLEGAQKVVTLQGMVFQANGILISGESASGKRISRTREQNEMQQDLSQLKDKIKKLIDSREDVEKTIADLQQEIEGQQKKKKQAEETLDAFRKEQLKEQESFTRLVEQVAWHEERFTVIGESLENTQAAIKMEESRLEDLGAKIEEFLTQEGEANESVNAFPLFEIQQERNQWQTHQIVAQNALATSKQRYQDFQQRIKESQQRLQTFQTRLVEITAGLTEIAQTEEKFKSEIDEINHDIEIIQSKQIYPLSIQGKEAEKSVSSLEESADTSHQQVIIAERQYTQMQLELDRRHDQLSHLQERIEDDFGLVSFEYEQKIDGRNPLPFENGYIKDLPQVEELSENIEDEIKRLKTQLRRMGAINPEAQQEYTEVKDRFEFLTEQIQDLEKASKDLQSVIEELDVLMERDFVKTFKAVNAEFSAYFSQLFNGGEAKLLFADEDQPVEGGVDIEARLPGRRRQGLALLSGGERSLTAVALVFALLKVSPTPFCILDEVDAMLDESNVGRFIELLKELSRQTQFVVITHNRNTVQAADVIYGVTMGRDSTSQMISLKLDEVDETYLE